MKLVDVNVLLYVVNHESPYLDRVRAWWENALAGDEPVGLAWVMLLGFLRLSTHRKVFHAPLTIDEAVAMVTSWLEQPNVEIIEENRFHWQELSKLLTVHGISGGDVTDAHIAALAITHEATLASCDVDFGDFAGISWENPLAD